MMNRTVKNIFAAIAIIAGSAVTISCADHRNDYMEDYMTMSYFRNGGEQNLPLYRTGEDGWYSIPVCKGGRNLSGSIAVEIMPLDQQSIQIYNAANFTDYTAVPRNLYSFFEEDEETVITDNPVRLVFGAEESVKVVKLKVETTALKVLMDAFPDRDYVIGLQLFSAEGKVSDDINLLIIRPVISVPYLGFSINGVFSDTYSKKAVQNATTKEETYSNRVKFTIDRNNWNFDCRLEVKDAAWLAAYNASHGTEYELLPAKFYSIPEALEFKEGEKEVPFDVTIYSKKEGENIPALRAFALPVAIEGAYVGNTPKPEFVPFTSEEQNESTFMLSVVMTPDSLTVAPAQITAFYDGKDDHTTDKLVDGDATTYWTSPGSYRYGGFAGDAVWGFYFDIDIQEHPLDAFVIGYLPYNIPVRVPTRIRLGVSDDGVNFTEIADEHTEAMRNRTTWYDLPLVKLDHKVKFIRVGLLETYINGGVQPLNIDTVDMTCEMAEIHLFGD
ncbi:MAG: DUF1735 domain-containing protein [Bacteroidales bacterium]|nr:DUF1735 domain-containing protein [Bacteroidales bacterium]